MDITVKCKPVDPTGANKDSSKDECELPETIKDRSKKIIQEINNITDLYDDKKCPGETKIGE